MYLILLQVSSKGSNALLNILFGLFPSNEDGTNYLLNEIFNICFSYEPTILSYFSFLWYRNILIIIVLFCTSMRGQSLFTAAFNFVAQLH